MTNSKSIDWLNIGLIAVSLVAAFLLPFRLFLFSYAILGPLHYLTEINWIRDKQYFVNGKSWVWLAVALSALIVVPHFLFAPFGPELTEGSAVEGIAQWFGKWSTSGIFLALVIALSFVALKKPLHRGLLIAVGAVLAVLLNSIPFYLLLIGLMIPTVIHVYVFTMLFMLYGAMKSKSLPGYLGFALGLLVPVLIVFVDVDPSWYAFPQEAKSTFEAGNFHLTNTKIAHFLGFGDGKSFYFYEVMELKLQIFIAFAYTYHYLNWFSKTTVIGWHKGLSVRNTAIIVGVWLLAMGVLWYDFSIAFMLLLLLSTLHVVLEFPLNVISIRGIGQEAGKLFKP